MLSRLRGVLGGNWVVPVALVLASLVIFGWVLFGLISKGSEEEPTVDPAAVSRSQEGNQPGEGSDTLAPETENRDVDSYAAYEAKDPFRELVAPAEPEEDESTTEDTTEDDSETEETTAENENGSTSGDDSDPPGGATTGTQPPDNGGGQGRRDSDNDGLTDRRERVLGTDPNNRDTDNDNIRDGRDDANSDGLPDSGGGRNRGGQDRDGGLPDSGGSLQYGGK